MANASVLTGWLLASLSSAALAGTAVTGLHAAGAQGSHSAPVTGMRAGGNASPTLVARSEGASPRSNAAPHGATVTRAMVGGEHANVVQVAMKRPLTERERRKLSEQGFEPVMQNGETYFCHHVRWTENGWVKDCFEAVR